MLVFVDVLSTFVLLICYFCATDQIGTVNGGMTGKYNAMKCLLSGKLVIICDIYHSAVT